MPRVCSLWDNFVSIFSSRKKAVLILDEAMREFACGL